MMAGFNADEGTLFYSEIESPTVLRSRITGTLEEREDALASVFGLNPAKALQALYGMNTLESWDRGATDMLGDDLFGVHMRYVGRRNAQTGQPTYLYHFTRVPPSPRQTIGAFHAAEISFVFDSHLPGLKVTEGDRALTEAMMTYWTNFARTGDPNGPGVPEWPAYSVDRDVWLDLNHSIRVIEGLRARRLDILEENLLKRIEQMAGPPLTPTVPEPVDAAVPPANIEALEEAEPGSFERAPVIRERPVTRPAVAAPPPAETRPPPQPAEELPAPVLQPLNPPVEAPVPEPAQAAEPGLQPVSGGEQAPANGN